MQAGGGQQIAELVVSEKGAALRFGLCAETETAQAAQLFSELAALDERIFGASAWGQENFQKNAAQAYDHLLLCLEQDDVSEYGRVCGYALLRAIDDAELLLIGVDEALRGQGIGRRLLSAALELAGEKAVFLEVRAGNIPARRLYEACGFSEIDVRKRYYKAPEEDAVLMERKADVRVER